MHTLRDKRIVVFGGTGFIGRQLTTRLAGAGAYVTVMARYPQRCQQLGVLPRVRMVRGDVRDAVGVGQVLAGQHAAINLVGVLDGSERQLQALHVDWPKRLVGSGRALERIVHLGAVNADADGPSRYLVTKGRGEAAIRESGTPWTIVAPSVVFGAGDTLFNKFALLLRLSPGVMPVVRPAARYSPVHVGDVAEAVVRALLREDTAGRRLSLGGPEIWTMREMLVYTRRQIEVRRLLIDLPESLARMQAMVMGLLPGRPFSSDQYRTLSVDGTAEPTVLRELGVEPATVDEIVPTYLGRGRLQARLDRFRQEANRLPVQH